MLGDTQVSIINNVLVPLHVKPILNLSQTNNRSMTANTLWDQARQECLSDLAPGFADRRVQLTQLSQVPAFEFPTYWQLPPDALKVNFCYPDQSYSHAYTQDKWRVEYDGQARVIVAQVASGALLYCRYTANITDVTVFPPDFISALKLLLKSRFAVAFREDKQMEAQAYQAYKMEVEELRGKDDGDLAALVEERWQEPPFDLIASRWG